MSRTYSSVTIPRCSNGGVPSASNSSRSQPTPMPRRTRPPDELIDGGEHLGGEHRMAVGNDQHAGAESRARGDARQAREHRDGLEVVLGGAARQLPGRRVRIDGAGHRGRKHDVIGDEDRSVAERVGLRGDLQHLVGAGHRATAGKRDAELHESLRNDASGSVTPAHSRPRVQALQSPGAAKPVLAPAPSAYARAACRQARRCSAAAALGDVDDPGVALPRRLLPSGRAGCHGARSHAGLRRDQRRHRFARRDLLLLLCRADDSGRSSARRLRCADR